jgi:CheY-like chemotaxis protein
VTTQDTGGSPKPVPLRILVVDDHPLMAEALRHILERDGHRVSVANRGADGFQAVEAALEREAPFDTVLMDFSMPDLDGITLARMVKELSSSTTVVLVTAGGIDPDDDLPENVDAVVSKPPRLDDIRAAVSRSARRG